MDRRLTRVGVVTALTVAAAAVLVPLTERFPILCFYRAATGHLCIFCGMTHALARVAHADWAGAYAANPAWFLIFPAFVAVVALNRGKVTWAMVALAVVGTALRW